VAQPGADDHRAHVAEDRRVAVAGPAEAEALCNRIRGVGGACLVLKT
jgi:hypothetical protein